MLSHKIARQKALGLSGHPAATSALPGTKSVQYLVTNFSARNFFRPTLCFNHLKKICKPFFE